jgi:hypothetical protein
VGEFLRFAVIALVALSSLGATGVSTERHDWTYDCAMQRGREYLVAEEDYPSAAECFRRALQQDPASVEAYFFLGKTYEAFGAMDYAWYYSNRAYFLARGESSKASVSKWITKAGLYLGHGWPDSIGQYDGWSISWPESVVNRRCPPLHSESSSDSARAGAGQAMHMVRRTAGAETASPKVSIPPRPDEFYEFSPPPPPPDTSMREASKYPALALEEGIEGPVIVMTMTDETGKVIRAWIHDPAAPILNDAGLRGAYRMRFSTARSGGLRPFARISVPFAFRQ